MNKINNKVAIITGASDGIGKETCKIIAKEIGTIVIGCRNKEKGEIAAKEISLHSGNNNIIILDLDLSKQNSVKSFVNEFDKLNLPLDLLINNAGVMCPPFSITQDGFSFQISTNHFGPFLLTNLLLKKLEKSENPRILVLTSDRFKDADLSLIINDKINVETQANYNPLKDYSLSKCCNLLFTKELQRKLIERRSKIIVNSINPGKVQTSLQRDFTGVLKFAFNLMPNFIFTPIQVASKECAKVALGIDSSTHNVKGSYFNIGVLTETPNQFNNIELSKKLWEISSRYTNISNDLIL
ncbi:hypothetical protein RB653_003443 [Dictyostelium firmibasis]|uniref:Uncharacterized protein n=1 Tax=Dictyostelium firmibasis TaxID=79012 RepID=A0AAN7U825_9MYCE